MSYKFAKRMRTTVLAVVSLIVFAFAGCSMDLLQSENDRALAAERCIVTPPDPVDPNDCTDVILGTASTFSVLGGTTVTSSGLTVLSNDLGVSPGTAITGFEPEPINTIEGPGTVTAGLGLVEGTIYAGGPVAAAAHADAQIAYDYLVAQVPGTILGDVYQLDGVTFTPGIYNFPSSANLQVNGILTLDFQGDPNAQFIFQLGSTLVTMAGSQVVAINNGDAVDCVGSHVYWTVGSSATISGESFIGTLIAYTSITMGFEAQVSGRMLALGGAVTMLSNTVTTCGDCSTDPTDPPVDPAEGLSHGYWKNHPASWVGYSPWQTVGSVFSGATRKNSSATLMEALSFKGGSGVEAAERILLIQAVASLLNAAHPEINFPYTVEEVIAMVSAALASDDRQVMIDLKDELDMLNNAGGSIENVRPGKPGKYGRDDRDDRDDRNDRDYKPGKTFKSSYRPFGWGR